MTPELSSDLRDLEVPSALQFCSTDLNFLSRPLQPAPSPRQLDAPVTPALSCSALPMSCPSLQNPPLGLFCPHSRPQPSLSSALYQPPCWSSCPPHLPQNHCPPHSSQNDLPKMILPLEGVSPLPCLPLSIASPVSKPQVSATSSMKPLHSFSKH